MNTENEKSLISKSILKLEEWIEENDYKGFDPADGLTSFLRPLTFNNFYLERLLLQVVWKSPINLRPILGIKPLRTNIATGYMARGYLCRYKTTKDIKYIEKATSCLDWLIDNRAPNFANFSWGKMFDFVSRGGRQKMLEPITVWTSLIGHSFLDAYEILGDVKYLKISRSICNWIIERPRNYTDNGFCINYTAFGKGNCTIHNQSMLAASLLARTGRILENTEFMRVAEQAIKYSCERQLPDGSWYYGEEDKYHWVDSFHTGYNLDALKCYIENSGDKTYKSNLLQGYNYFKTNFFLSNGTPKYYHNRTFPLDIQCAAQAIETFANFYDHDSTSLSEGIKIAIWTVNNMQDRSGFFYYRKYPFIITKVPMIHWGQATTYTAMAQLLSKLDSKNVTQH